MKPHSKFRAVLWLLLLFTGGAVLGSAVAPRKSFSTGWWRSAANAAPESYWVQRRFDNMSERFDLSAGQKEALLPAFEESESQLREIRERAAEKTRRVIIENNRAIMEVMTPEQKKAFEAWRSEYRARAESNP